MERRGCLGKQKKKNGLITSGAWDNLGWGVPGCTLDMDMTGTVDQSLDQTIRIFGLRCDMYCVWSPAPTHPPTQAQTQTRPRTPPRNSEKSLTDGCTGKIHSGDQNILRHCLSNVLDLVENYNERKTGQRKKGTSVTFVLFPLLWDMMCHE